MAKIWKVIKKNLIAWLYFEHSKEELIETTALKLTPRGKIELECLDRKLGLIECQITICT